LDLGEQAAGGDEAVGAQLGVVGQVQVDVHDASSSRAACPSLGHGGDDAAALVGWGVGGRRGGDGVPAQPVDGLVELLDGAVQPPASVAQAGHQAGTSAPWLAGH
jgi:hypothetical protein